MKQPRTRIKNRSLRGGQKKEGRIKEGSKEDECGC
jgi:hypothetical protein